MDVMPVPSDNACPVPEPFRKRLGPILFLTFLFFLGFIGRVIFAPLMPSLEREAGLSHAQAGSLFLMISIGFFAAQIGSGFITSRLNHKGALAISALGVGVALLGFGVSHSLNAIRLLMVLLGVATGLHLPSAIATITAMVTRRDWGKGFGIQQTAPSLGLVLAPLLVQAFLGPLSWRAIVVSLGAVALGAAIVFVVTARCGEFGGQAPKPAVIRETVQQPSFWIMVLLFSLGMGGSIGLYSMLPLFLVEERGFDLGWANTLLGISRISGLFMAFIAGWITDRVGERRAITAVLAASGLSTILLGIVSGSWLIVIIFVQPMLIACYFPPGFSALARIVPPRRRSVTTSLTTPSAFLLGGGIVPTFLGYMGEKTSFSMGIVLVGCVTLLAPLAVRFLRLREGTEDGC